MAGIDLRRAAGALLREVDRAVAHAGLTIPSPVTAGTLIARHRAEQGLSLEALAKRAGLAKGYVWEMEQDRARNPSVASCYALATALGMPFVDLASAILTTTPLRPDGAPDAPK